MKSNIHPIYHENAKVRCACGNEWTTGSTKSEFEIEICSNCHPFYTGKEKTLDTRGRIDRFKKRIQKLEDSNKAKLEANGVKTKKPRVKKDK